MFTATAKKKNVGKEEVKEGRNLVFRRSDAKKILAALSLRKKKKKERRGEMVAQVGLG